MREEGLFELGSVTGKECQSPTSGPHTWWANNYTMCCIKKDLLGMAAMEFLPQLRGIQRCSVCLVQQPCLVHLGLFVFCEAACSTLFSRSVCIPPSVKTATPFWKKQ
jgi:hypothetical protein